MSKRHCLLFDNENHRILNIVLDVNLVWFTLWTLFLKLIIINDQVQKNSKSVSWSRWYSSRPGKIQPKIYYKNWCSVFSLTLKIFANRVCMLSIKTLMVSIRILPAKRWINQSSSWGWSTSESSNAGKRFLEDLNSGFVAGAWGIWFSAGWLREIQTH